MTLTRDLDLFEAEATEHNPYEKYFLLKNPFPGYGETGFDVCTGQDGIKGAFVSILQNFSSEAKRLRINGTNGAGKTNILQYFELLTDAARRSKRIKNLHPIYVYAPGESYFDFHEQIVERLAVSFLEDLFASLKSDQGLADKLQLANELSTVIKSIAQPHAISFALQEELQKDIFIRWLKGQKLSVADKKLLTISGTPLADITSSSLAIRFLGGLLVLLKRLELCDGIVLLFDEFEEIFEGLTRSRQSRYAQDLRHLFDTLKESVFFVIATVPEPKDLGHYPAIERRLGDPVDLQSIDNLNLATDYVLDYLNSERDKFETALKGRDKGLERPGPEELKPLTPAIVEEEYNSFKAEVEKAGLEVLPGYFLPQMRERIKQIVEGST